MDRSHGFSFMDNIIALGLLSIVGVLILLQHGKLAHNMHDMHVRNLAADFLDDSVESFIAGAATQDIPSYYKLTTSQSGHTITFVLRYGKQFNQYVQRQRLI